MERSRAVQQERGLAPAPARGCAVARPARHDRAVRPGAPFAAPQVGLSAGTDLAPATVGRQGWMKTTRVASRTPWLASAAEHPLALAWQLRVYTFLALRSSENLVCSGPRRVGQPYASEQRRVGLGLHSCSLRAGRAMGEGSFAPDRASRASFAWKTGVTAADLGRGLPYFQARGLPAPGGPLPAFTEFHVCAPSDGNDDGAETGERGRRLTSRERIPDVPASFPARGPSSRP